MGLWGFGKKALNSSIGTNEFKPLDVLLGGFKEFYSNGTFIVPENVSEIYITSCGGGGSGSTIGSIWGYGAGGGSGAMSIYGQKYNVTPKSSIDITVGIGGASVSLASTNGNNGTSTVIGSLITLLGGKGGIAVGSTVQSVGAGSGSGGKTVKSGIGENGGDGSVGLGGVTTTRNGGGGGSLGNGGYSNTESIGVNGKYGSGGSGGSTSGEGGDGYVLIYWGTMGSIFNASKQFIYEE